eukprot:PhF_6_TR6092/c0_g1_i6/m.8927
MGCAPSAQSRWRHVVSESKKKENYLADHFPLSHHQTKTLKPSSNLRKTNNGNHSPAVSLSYTNLTATFIVDEDMDPNPRKPRKIRTNTLDPETRKKLEHIGGVPADAWSRRSGQDSLESSRSHVSRSGEELNPDDADLVAQFAHDESDPIPTLITPEGRIGMDDIFEHSTKTTKSLNSDNGVLNSSVSSDVSNGGSIVTGGDANENGLGLLVMNKQRSRGRTHRKSRRGTKQPAELKSEVSKGGD